MCSRKELFIELNESYESNIIFRDSTKRFIEENSKILIKCKNKAQDIIFDVYYISNMKSNILSLGHLLEIGCDIHMKELDLLIHDKNNILITHVHMSKDRMFLVNHQIQ